MEPQRPRAARARQLSACKLDGFEYNVIGRLYQGYFGLMPRRQALRLRRTAARLRGLTAALSRRRGIDAVECGPLLNQSADPGSFVTTTDGSFGNICDEAAFNASGAFLDEATRPDNRRVALQPGP